MTTDWLSELEQALAASRVDVATAVVVLAAYAGRDVQIPDEEAQAAARRALFVLASGGDPTRGLDLNGRAVQTVADDLDTPERRHALGEGLTDLAAAAAGLPHVAEAARALLAEPATAWRAYACSLLAEELEPE